MRESTQHTVAILSQRCKTQFRTTWCPACKVTATHTAQFSAKLHEHSDSTCTFASEVILTVSSQNRFVCVQSTHMHTNRKRKANTTRNVRVKCYLWPCSGLSNSYQVHVHSCNDIVCDNNRKSNSIWLQTVPSCDDCAEHNDAHSNSSHTHESLHSCSRTCAYCTLALAVLPKRRNSNSITNTVQLLRMQKNIGTFTICSPMRPTYTFSRKDIDIGKLLKRTHNQC